jgi:ATP-dependent Clp protease ATP-binding subunit ClpC
LALEGRLEELTGRVENGAFHERKRVLMARMTEPGFWESAQRFGVFGEIEYLDRIEVGLATSRSLLARLQDPGRKPRTSYPRDLVGRLAQQLYLLGAACADVLDGRPKDAFVEVDAGIGGGGTTDQRDLFARRVGRMYREWAARRGMQLEVLEESGGDGRQPYRIRLGISGYGAHSILAPEEGVHVHEVPEEDRGHTFRKCAIHVRVAPQPDTPPTASGERDRAVALRAQAIEALSARGTARLDIVRRYRDLPSPLVRDDVRGWRSGLLDVVLAGNFDVLR